MPTEAPSIWNLVQPGNTKQWLGPIIVLIVQVWLTGGFYGTLIRANTGEASNVPTFIVDSFRSFGKLLLWNLLWAAAAVVVIGLNRALPAFGPALNILIFLLRFVFLFGDIALVAEQNARYALTLAPKLVLSQWLVMLPFAIVMVIVTDAGRWLVGISPGVLGLIIAIIYAVVMTWVLHMIVARYLMFSNWTARRDSVNSLAES